MEIALIVLSVAVACGATFLLITYVNKLRSDVKQAPPPENLAAEVARLQERERGLLGEVGRLKQVTETADTSIVSLRDELTSARGQLLVAAERENALTRTISDKDEQLKTVQERLKAEFETIATNILTVATNQLSEKSEKSILSFVDPLKKQIDEFKNKIEVTHVEDTKQRTDLATQIRLMTEKSQGIGDQAEALTKALMGSSQVQGQWAEEHLQRILEKAGLVEGREFLIQGGDLNLKNEEGLNRRPDVIILLPENKHLIIDSKLSLVSYVEHQKAETDEARASASKRLLLSCRAHIDGLAKKNYQYAEAVNSHDLVLMFMGIESAAALALQSDDNLFEYAWSRRIVLVSPNTLFMAMRTVNSIWRYERQNLSAKLIAQQAGQLYDKLASFVEDLNDVSRKLEAAKTSHDEALKKLASGRGNVLSRAEKLKSLGVAPKKELPSVSVAGEKLLTFENDVAPDPDLDNE